MNYLFITRDKHNVRLSIFLFIVNRRDVRNLNQHVINELNYYKKKYMNQLLCKTYYIYKIELTLIHN